MKNLLIIFSIFIFSFDLFGQTYKPLGVILSPEVTGKLPKIKIIFLLKTLEEELSKYFDISTRPQNKSGECLVGCDFFQLKIIEENGNTLMSLRWMSETQRRIETKLCEGCETNELNGNLKNLIDNLLRHKKGDRILLGEHLKKGVLFLRLVDKPKNYHHNHHLQQIILYEVD